MLKSVDKTLANSARTAETRAARSTSVSLRVNTETRKRLPPTKAREIAVPYLAQIRDAIGIRKLG